jgi:hypothetical protein
MQPCTTKLYSCIAPSRRWRHRWCLTVGLPITCPASIETPSKVGDPQLGNRSLLAVYRVALVLISPHTKSDLMRAAATRCCAVSIETPCSICCSSAVSSHHAPYAVPLQSPQCLDKGLYRPTSSDSPHRSPSCLGANRIAKSCFIKAVKMRAHILRARHGTASPLPLPDAPNIPQ